MKRPARTGAALLALLPVTAMASDMTGVLTLMVLGYFVAPLTVIHLLITAALALSRAYRSLKMAVWHSVGASIAPVVGMVVVNLELGLPKHASGRALLTTVMFGLLALAWLPLLIHSFQRIALDVRKEVDY